MVRGLVGMQRKDFTVTVPKTPLGPELYTFGPEMESYTTTLTDYKS